jgi:hypothetical protein
MVYLRKFRALVFVVLLVWIHQVHSHENVRIAHSRVSGFVVKDGVTRRVCQGMDTSVTGAIVREGQNFDAVKFNNGPCAGYWAWVPKRDLQGVTTKTEAQVCENCEVTPRRQTVREQIEAVTGALGSNYYALPGSAGQGLCSQFVQSNGQLGDYGRRTLAAIQAVDPGGQCFLGGGIAWSQHVCPGYRSFSQRERERFWVYAFAAIAHDESSCNPNVSGDGGASDGLFQMEYSNWKRRFRGRECAPRTPINSRGLKFQFECTASIMRDINCGKPNKPLGNGNGNTIFWSQLQNTNGDVSRMIKRYPGCL